MLAVDARRTHRQDTFDLRDQILADDHAQHAQAHADAANYPSDEEHSVLEDDSDNENGDGDYMDDDDASSELSIPNESIDFDLVYALHSFAATVEGQANVVKGDSLFLMDDSNSYWWLVRVLKTQEVGYIPAENIETPFERLARLNKHRNVDLSSATQTELQIEAEAQRLHNKSSSRQGQPTPSPTPAHPISRSRAGRSVIFQASFQVHRYPPAVWNEEEEEDEDIEWDDEGYEDEDPDLVDEPDPNQIIMEPDDGMSWEDGAAEEIQRARSQSQGQLQGTANALGVQPRPGEHQTPGLVVRGQASPDRMARNGSPSGGSPLGGNAFDPANVMETVKLSATPPIVQEGQFEKQQMQKQQQPQPQQQQSQQQQRSGTGPLMPSTIMQQHSDERKRTREEIEALEQETRKRANSAQAPPRPSTSPTPSAGSGSTAGGKLRKERDREEEDNSKDKKKKGGVFGGLFGRRKDKGKDKGMSASDSGNGDSSRPSDESGRSSSQHHAPSVESTSSSPVTSAARQQQQQQMVQQQQQVGPRVQQQPQQAYQQGSPPSTQAPQTTLAQLRQRDQQQQQLYQQYLNRSPSSPPDLQPSYGLQSASAVMPLSNSFSSAGSGQSGAGLGLSPESAGRRPRPGSLILSPGAMDGQGAVPELSVIRVFAGNNLQTEATFKTVLLNTSTTSQDLVRQAIQRFRLPAGEDENDYYLMIKQVEGSSAVLRPDEKPLGVFESLVEAVMELPKVKRSSVGSISSVSSNLSMHPAIKKLSMNDFTDDSTVKFYLNRKGEDGTEEHFSGDEVGDALAPETPQGDQFLSVNNGTGANMAADRFNSPSYRFALQLVIYPEDLPDDMAFDNQTEAIVFKRDRIQSNVAPGLNMNLRRKIFVFPKNVTVAEVIELGLERFGILEGVVDGGDEIEDKLSKRRSSVRVRYGLNVHVGNQERELSPSGKVIDAYPQAPTYRAVDRRFSDSKRRSADSGMLLGSSEDVGPEDPIFVLRRAVTYRTSSSRRISAPLDEVALQRMHRESASGSSTTSASDASDKQETRQLSKQEIIAAQRAAVRANQRAVLSAQANSDRGVDVLLTGNAKIRSSRYDVDQRMRYSYVDPDGETFDISEIIEEELKKEGNVGSRGDLLEGLLSRNKDGVGEKLDRVLSKIKDGKAAARPPLLSAGSAADRASSVYSVDQEESDNDANASRSTTPVAAAASVRFRTPTSGMGSDQRVATPSSPTRTVTPTASDIRGQRSRTNTPTAAATGRSLGPSHQKQSSIASVLSEQSNYRSAAGTPIAGSRSAGTPRQRMHKPVLPKDDFGISNMMAVIEVRAAAQKAPALDPLDPTDEMLFGREIDVASLHPQIRDIYSESFRQLEDMDKTLDGLLSKVFRAR